MGRAGDTISNTKPGGYVGGSGEYARLEAAIDLDRAAQSALLYVGLDPGPVDGVPGRRTRSALLTFQQQHGLPETGNLSAATEATLVRVAFPAATV